MPGPGHGRKPSIQDLDPVLIEAKAHAETRWTGQVHEDDPIEMVIVCAAALPKMMVWCGCGCLCLCSCVLCF